MSSKESNLPRLQFKDEDGIVGWWLKNIKEASGEYFNRLWDSFPEDTKKVVANQLRMATVDIAEAQLSIIEVKKLLAIGGVSRFFDALIESLGWPDNWKSPHNFKYNLAKHIGNSFRQQYDIMDISSPIKPRIVKHPVSDETIARLDPFTKKLCSVCHKKRLNKNNTTGRCRDCQKRKVDEH